ncbi:MAG TPA: peptidoglycan-binding domain-containing protein [Blastocatellia bacterium]|nr:peptidoglycan-binding domain-containing protein [Blastocatellia bacterium]
MRRTSNISAKSPGAYEQENEFERSAIGEHETRVVRRFPTVRSQRRPRPIRSRERRRPQHPILGCRSGWCGPAIVNVEPPEGSEYVRWVQTSLNRALGLDLPVDGVADAATRSAIRSFQRRKRLTETGVVGPDTERALIAAASTPPPARDDGAGAQREIGGPNSRNSKQYVQWLQHSLNRIAKAGLIADGTMGARTRYALRRFRRSAGLKAGATIDAGTEAALVKAGAEPPPRSASSASEALPPGVCPQSCRGCSNRDCPRCNGRPTSRST